MKQSKALSLLEKTYIGILLVVFGGIVLHAPLTVALGSIFPGLSLLIKSWKEILMLIAGLILLYILFRKKRFQILSDPIIVLIVVYAVLHLMLLMVFRQGVAPTLAGLAIDLRYFLYFGLVYIALLLFPKYRPMFLKVGIVGALVVLMFAILQVFILPKDILQYIGYSKDTISPYLTIDENNAFIRINSTLRGPNPLGAYAAIVLAIAVAVIAKLRLKERRDRLIAGLMLTGGVVALWSSYSRSAWIAGFVAVIAVLVVSQTRKLSAKTWIIASIVLASLGIIVATQTSFVSNILLHENPNEGNNINSNEGHLQSLTDGFNRSLSRPWGSGVGSTGSASLLGDKPQIVENQYLFVAHEVGWLGLGLFMAIFGMVMVRLWRTRDDWLALGIFASGIGLAIIGLLLPVFVDDTVSIIWWGLAAVALATYNNAKGKKK